MLAIKAVVELFSLSGCMVSQYGVCGCDDGYDVVIEFFFLKGQFDFRRIFEKLIQCGR